MLSLSLSAATRLSRRRMAQARPCLACTPLRAQCCLTRAALLVHNASVSSGVRGHSRGSQCAATTNGVAWLRDAAFPATCRERLPRLHINTALSAVTRGRAIENGSTRVVPRCMDTVWASEPSAAPGTVTSPISSEIASTNTMCWWLGFDSARQQPMGGGLSQPDDCAAVASARGARCGQRNTLAFAPELTHALLDTR